DTQRGGKPVPRSRETRPPLLPAIYQAREYVVDGGLMSYGAALSGYVQTRRPLRRANPQRRPARRAAGRAVVPLRAGNQHEDSRGARPAGFAHVAYPRRRGDRITTLSAATAHDPLWHEAAARFHALVLSPSRAKPTS